MFDPKLTAAPGFWESLVKVTEAKYGKIKDKKQVEKKLVTWVNRKFKIAQLSKFPGSDGEFFQLESDLN
jgi:hypothetical protein